MKTIITSLCVLVLLSVPSSIAAGLKKPTDGFSLIKNIRSPQELLFPYFPKKYCVPVTLTGSIADEMKSALDSLKIEMPLYNESFNGAAFDLVIANDSYTSQTRELLSGILNPVELIDIVVSSVVKYRQPEEFSKMMGETKVVYDTCTYANEPAYKVSLVPKGERFAYSYQDMGAFVHESWLTMLTLTINASTRLVYELSTVRYSRTFGTGSEKPKADMMNARYLFVYEEKDSVPLPHRLTVYFNNTEVLKLQATYRKKDKLFLFDNKELCTSIEGKPACLNVHYGDYRFALCKYAQEPPKAQGKKYSKRLEKAAILSKEANDLMRKGKISKAIRVLQRLAEKYGDTPQAVEAKRLLSQLPRELQ